MSVVVSDRRAGNGQDLLSGTLGGVLPGHAQYYDCKLTMAHLAHSGEAFASLQVGGQQVLDRALIGYGHQVKGSSNVVGWAFPDLRSTLVEFTAAAGSRITLNTVAPAADFVGYHFEADESGAAGFPGAAHIGKIAVAAGTAINEFDVLSGSPVGSVPTATGVYEVSIAACLRQKSGNTTTPANLGGRLTFLVDSDAVCERLMIPVETNSTPFPYDEKNTVLSTLATAASKLTLNVFVDSMATNTYDLLYAVYCEPVG